VLQVGTPDEVVLRPASRRVAELIGYLGFVPRGGQVAGIHPERVMAGVLADRGLVLTGVVAAGRPAGAGWEADLRVGEEMITCRLPDKPPAPGGEMVVTVLDPPCFGPDGNAVPADAAEGGRPAPEGGRPAPEQVRRLSGDFRQSRRSRPVSRPRENGAIRLR
jgi:hypothetical protein